MTDRMETVLDRKREKPLVYGSRDRFLAEALIGTRIAVSLSDRAILRPLAAEVAKLAARPVEDDKRDLWYRHNALEPTRPLIFVDLENGWNEVLPPHALRCQGGLARQWELILRKEIFWATELQDDAVIRPHFDVPYVHNDIDWGVPMTQVGGDEGGAYTWEPSIKTEDDLERLRIPRIVVDREATARLGEVAEETLGDLLPVRLNTRWMSAVGMTSTLAYFRGLEQIMLDMYDNPALIHRLMAFIADGYHSMLGQLEEDRLLTLNNDGTYIGQAGFGWTKELPGPDFDGTVRLRDLWGNSESQETVGISPAMFAEFIFPYQLRLLGQFGLNCYGCCEPLEARWHVVERIPRLRRVSVSPFANLAAMAEKLGDRYIFSMKPSPTNLAMRTFDEGRVRAELRQALQTTRHCRVEVILKDTHTLRNNPLRAVRWARIAKEESIRL